VDYPILVTGASGRFARDVLRHLTDTLSVPPGRIVAASRTPDALAQWAAQGVETRVLDFDRPETFAPAFAGVARVLLVSTDAVDRPGRRLAQQRAAIAGMEQAKVRHAIYTSAPNPVGAPLVFAPDHEGTEDALAQSGLPGWTVLRNHWYFENLLQFLQPAIVSGQWYTADEGQGSADIARDDLALAAAIVLAGEENGKRIHTLSGDRALTKVEIAETVGRALGKRIEVVQIPLEALVQGMVQTGVPEPFARLLASFDSNTADGRMAEVTDDFRRVTGRAPKPFATWVAENREVLAAL
jgi:NAD(P)H dehydrogenase (quinone)